MLFKGHLKISGIVINKNIRRWSKNEKIFPYLYIFLIIISFSLSLKVGIYEYPSIIYKEGEEIKSILPEILEYIAKKEGFDIKYVYSTFAVGGDEFFIALYNCNLKDAKRIEKNITNDLIEISKKEKINYSVSFGFIEYDHKETVDSIISKADEIMYQNKRKKKQ
jgi:hypothetical protein